ncbi:MAG TPA: OmpH family outer membrane protein [Sedimentisphaerales bacterium]|jgi:Skp family chaperone for outer membrane proteins|nr:OmpH family outer membrane protein [Sedimentisphaerales bacterium]
MKRRTMLLGCLIGVVVLFAIHQYGVAQANSAKPVLPIATVSVSQALRDCKATAKYRDRTTAENNRMDAEEDKLSKEIQALAAGLRTGALRPDSADYMQQYQDLLQKQAELKIMQEVNPQKKALKYQLWTEKLYKEILRITKELAAQKGLALVLAVDEPEFPMTRYEDLAMALRTHKVLYNGGCLDLTGEVIAEMDKIETKLIN